MYLDPEEYHCPTHPGVDLTDAIRKQLDDSSDVAYGRRRLRLARTPARDVFTVVVACPGDPAVERSAHRLSCSGEYWA